MVHSASINIALDTCALAMMALVFWRLVSEGKEHGTRERLLAAALLHAGALVCRVAANIFMLSGLEQPKLLFCFAIVLDACSACAFAACVLTDSDGRIRLAGRLVPLSSTLVGWSIGPCAIASAVDSLVCGIVTLDVAYTISLCVACLLLQRKNEEELARRELEVECAQSKVFAEQMSPHFVFKTLTSISSLCYTDPDAAAEAIADLSGYLRGNIDALSSDEPIPFEKELSHIRQYVALEQADPARVFVMEYDLAAKPFTIPPLTVQPLVENAIKHGALAREDGLGWVRLSTEDRGRFVRVVVEDNGLGGNSSEVDGKQQKAHNGVGLQSVERRLSVYGGSLTARFGEDGGWACVLVPREEGRR